MKKVLALVLALTMVLGFAATASAYWTNVEYNLFKDGQEPVYTIDGIEGVTEADVDGNKEYTIKAKFDSDDLNNFLGNNDSTYDMLYQEYQVLKAIDSFTGYVSENWRLAALMMRTISAVRAMRCIRLSSPSLRILRIPRSMRL